MKIILTDKLYGVSNFVTYLDKEDSVFKKRKKTIERWNRGREPLVTFKNIITNVTIVGFVSRCRTDNKLLKIKDDRGLEVEITIENFNEILPLVTIEKGKILDKVIFGFQNGKVYLIVVDSPLYKKIIEDKKQSEKDKVNGYLKLKDLQIGKTYSCADNNRKYVYIGKRKIINELHAEIDNYFYSYSYNYNSQLNKNDYPKYLDTFKYDEHMFIELEFFDKKNPDKFTASFTKRPARITKVCESINAVELFKRCGNKINGHISYKPKSKDVSLTRLKLKDGERLSQIVDIELKEDDFFHFKNKRFTSRVN